MYKLVIQDDEGKTTVVPLIRDEITIGRKEGNTIRLTERNVSRKHARIVRANGSVAIEDLGSYNGVRVNGTRISQRTPLTVSDRVQIGDYLIELKAEGAEQGVAAPASYEDAKTQPVERVAGQPLPGMAPPPVPMQGNPNATMVALSDTDPRMPRAPVAAASPQSTISAHARLVVLSSNFAGRDFELTKAQMVIGRTDDNDVVVNHRSISRNHAKVVREAETGRYTIMDLQSSNGVRVNGEEYGKVELRRGDIIDLGHVRMRFVDVGEDFLFGRDAQVVDVPTSGGKGIWIGLIALLLVGGAVGIFFATKGGGDDGDKGSSTAASTGSSSSSGSQAASAVVTPDAAQAVAMKTADAGTAAAGSASGSASDAGKQLGALRDQVQQAIDAEHWPDVLMTCKQILQLAPGDAECTQKVEQAKLEEGAQLKFQDFEQAVGQKDYPKVASTFREIDDNSLYKERARPDHDKMRDEYVGEIKAKAEALANDGKCNDIKKLATEAGKNWKEAEDAAKAVLATCKTAVASNDHTGHGGNGGSNTTNTGHGGNGGSDSGSSSTGGSNTSSGGGSCDAAATAQSVTDANDAARNGQYGKALRSAEAALKCDSGNQQALTAAAIAACNLKDASAAKKYINRLNGDRKGMARQICLRNNVTVE